MRETEPAMNAAARLLPSGDAYYLLDGAERTLLVPDADRRGELWTSRVWPGALLVDGEIRGTWRRAGRTLRIEAWERLAPAAVEAVAAEAAALPLPGLTGPVVPIDISLGSAIRQLETDLGLDDYGLAQALRVDRGERGEWKHRCGAVGARCENRDPAALVVAREHRQVGADQPANLDGHCVEDVFR